MRAICCIFLVAATASAQPAEDLTRQAMQLLDARSAQLAGLTTRDQLAERQAKVRRLMLDQIGGLPTTKSPLNARTTGGFQRAGYRVENVIFESLPGFRVTANLYIPEGSGPFPAVLGVAGHSANGKAYPVYQHVWIALARRGYVVLAYDPPGQGERLEYFDPDLGKSKVGVGVAEHIMAGQQCLLTGSNIARYQIWDGIRAVDYLLTRKEVDPKRIAVGGNSGGGTQSAYLAVFEPRLAAVVASCYITGWRELWKDPGPQDSEQLFAGFLRDGLDFGDFALAAAPRPFLMTTAIRDFFPIAGARATYKEIERTYERLGVSERAGYFEFDDRHGWSQPRREAAYRFLDRWLGGKSSSEPEPTLETEPESLLWATPTGQLATSLGSETVQSLNARLSRELAAQRGSVDRARIGKRLGIEWTPINPTSQERLILTLGTPKADLVELQRLGIRTQPVNVRVASEGPRVLGDYSPAYQMAGRAWLVGTSVAAMQVQDVLAAVRSAAGPVTLLAHGAYGPIALMAAALEPAIERIAVEGSILSYQDVVDAKIHQGMESQIIPGVLRDFDLPDLVRLIQPRKLLILSPVHPNGARLARLPKVDGAEVQERPEMGGIERIYNGWLKSGAR